MSLLEISREAFSFSFLVYCVAFILYGYAVMGRTWRNRDPERHLKKWGKISFIVSLIGLLLHFIYFFTRWAGSGHIPVSNMFEFMSFLSMMIMFSFVVLFLIYRKTLLGLFAVPLAIVIMAYAAVFPQEVQPLIPSLQSIWLQIHVTLAALGESFFAIGFVAGFMYLLRTVDFTDKGKSAVRKQRWIEFTWYSLIVVVGFIVAVFAFRSAGYETIYTQQDEKGIVSTVTYNLPPIVAPHNGVTEDYQSFLGMKSAWFDAPTWMAGANAGRKFNTVLWSLIVGSILYGLIRLALRKPISKQVSPYLKGLDPRDLDEISYRAIAIGFPIFTLGALIFAMMWAQIAWGRFWGWDPKEVWALITWLFYSAYLHLRLSRGWQGSKSSWLAVIGFMVVMFTLVGVNLIIAGLHSYAGTE